ncbi:MAG: OmpH family outer membrane protein [Bacteroidia bacterium]|nr:OmpH family outer membrane protein [Bacteroidia bacterium]
MVKNAVIILSLILSVVSMVVCFTNKGEQTLFVDTGRIFEEFKMTKELNADFEKEFKARKNELDSLYRKITILNSNQSSTKPNVTEMTMIKGLQQEYLYKQDIFERGSQEEKAKMEGKIWNQINTYINEYGESEKLNLILGANGTGNIMYGNKAQDITNKIIEYVNRKYNGTNH